MPSAAISTDLILSIDQGTTNTKALLIDRGGQPVFRASRPVALLQPQPGYVEQDPVELWRSVRDAAIECAEYAQAHSQSIAGIAISNQRETALAWRPGVEGVSVTNAISWQCRRSSAQCERLVSHAEIVRSVTGLPLDPLLTASKWMWLFEMHPELLTDPVNGKLLLGTVDSWLIYQLTSGKVHATDHSNASRTALLNLETQQWDDAMLGIFNIPREAMPQIRTSSGSFGECSAIDELAGVPIVAAIGDSHAALAGHGHFNAATVKATYGTGSSLMMLTSQLTGHAESLARTIAWSTSEGVQFALEGNIAMTGSAMQWVGEFLGLANPSADAIALASTVPNAGGVVFVPAMVGLGAPHWNAAARGTIANLERWHTAAHLARAALDSIAFQVADVFFAMQQTANMHLPMLYADGGATRNSMLMQMQADILMQPVYRASNEELSAVGAATLGGLALGWWQSTHELSKLPHHVDTFMPSSTSDDFAALYRRWKLAVRRALLDEEEAR